MIFCIVILLGLGLKSKAQINSYEVYDPTQDEAAYLKLHEIYVALGYFNSFEDNIFNDTQREQASGGFGINVAYRFPVATSLHVGFEFDLLSFGVQEGNPQVSDLSINTVQVGGSGKWASGKGKLRPFISFGVFYVFGNMLDVDGFSLNTLSGYTVAAGAGCLYPVGEGISILAEFKSSAGRAQWLNLPSVDAIDRTFNPGGLSVNLGVILQFSSFQ